VGLNPTATAIYHVKRSVIPFTGDRRLCGWLHLSVHGGGLAGPLATRAGCYARC